MDIIQEIAAVFQEDGFEISPINTNQYNISYTKHAMDCAKITVIDREIHIDLITKCSPSGFIGSGKYIIEKLKQLADKIHYILVVDVDVSKITVNRVGISLAKLYLLSRGETWYNSLGFKEDTYDENTQNIEDYITRTNTRLMGLKDIASRGDFAEIRPEIEFISNSHPIKEIYTHIFDIITKLSKLDSGDNSVKTQILDKLNKNINARISTMIAANIFKERLKFFDLKYGAAATTRGAPTTDSQDTTEDIFPARKKTRRSSGGRRRRHRRANNTHKKMHRLLISQHT